MLVIENQSTFFRTEALPSLRPFRTILLVLRATVALPEDWDISLSRGSVTFKRKEQLTSPTIDDDSAYTHITVFMDTDSQLATRHGIPKSNGIVVALELSRLTERWSLRARLSREFGPQYLNPEETLKNGIIRKYHFNPHNSPKPSHHFDLLFLKPGICSDALLSQIPDEIRDEIDQLTNK